MFPFGLVVFTFSEHSAHESACGFEQKGNNTNREWRQNILPPFETWSLITNKPIPRQCKAAKKETISIGHDDKDKQTQPKSTGSGHGVVV